MSFFNNLRIGSRLGTAFGAVIALAAIVVVIGITRLSDISASLSLIGSDRVPKVAKLADVVEDVNLIARELRNALIWDDAVKVNEALDASMQARERTAKTLAAVALTITSDEGKKRLAALNEARSTYLPLQQSFMDQVRAGKKD